MSLRDYFAAKAMQPLMMQPRGSTTLIDDLARDAYRYADAMLAARKEGN